MKRDDQHPRVLPDEGGISREVDDEVRYHIERKIEKLVASGMSEDAARLEAERRFGDVDRIKKGMTQMSKRRQSRRRLADTWDGLRGDVAYAIRRLIKSPGFTAVTALTLTLGIGATTAVFSVVDGIVFRPLPYPEPEELVAVWSDYTRRGGPVDEWPNFADLWDLRSQSGSMEGVGIWIGGGGTITGMAGPAEFASGAVVNQEMFASVLRVEPALGTGFSPEDDRPGAPPTVLLSHGFWIRVYGGDPTILGKSLTRNGVPHTILGVMPEDFRPPFVPMAEIWTPLRMDMSAHSCGRGGACMQSIARLAPGATVESARTEASALSQRLAADFPDTNTGVVWNLQPLQADLIADTRVGLLILLGAAGFVLLIACVNEASLLLARGAGRRPELAVRAAIGADRGRILSQLMAESMMLALLGGSLGIAAAFGLVELLVAGAPAGTPRLNEVAVDGRVLAFAAAVTVLAGILFGILPALRGSRLGLNEALREGPRGQARPARVRARQALVAAQVALALVLLAGSGLLVRTFLNLRRVDLGFQPDGAFTFRVTLPLTRYEPGTPLVEFHDRLGERLSALPGVEAVGATSTLPLSGASTDRGFTIEGRPIPPPTESQAVWFQSVTPGFLEAIGTEVVRGRGFEAGDDALAPKVLVVNEAFARRHFQGQDPIGQRINFDDPNDPVWWSVVGVARDVKHFDVRNEARASLYVPNGQQPARALSYVLRTDRDPASLATEVRAALTELDPQLAVSQSMPLSEAVANAVAPERFVAMLLSLFAVSALALAVVGLYGVVSQSVNARLREMGVRLALGATGAKVATLVVTRSLSMVGIGLAIGLAGSVALTRLLESQLFEVEAGDPATFILATAVLAGAALLASLLPAWRAATVAPTEVLREE